MSWTSGIYTLPPTDFPPVTKTTITVAHFVNLMNDIVAAINLTYLRDGTILPTANLSMGSFKLTSLALATAKTDAASIANLQAQTGVACSASGVDTILLTPDVAWTAYAAKMVVMFNAAGANTGAVTINVSSLGAKALTKNGTTALAAGDIPAASAFVIAMYDGTRFVTKV